eukprot:CAMPEP_0201484348 /NCGR_PEP_ID=MMETSP0151_2-20130828/8543_1 /ASSEMBLY_ACC=CAM_ASM_000257 /TAXON_ID=200890 /ORGANISM="Paramoeba atlantica, Strain 621/1 / CCAP 1560/9" /LENGTH=270 /DNA_ID=CAMNT_0047867981 /DNA_START=118 /DNA_END=926 /DNA_ORIENTATION=-
MKSENKFARVKGGSTRDAKNKAIEKTLSAWAGEDFAKAKEQAEVSQRQKLTLGAETPQEKKIRMQQEVARWAGGAEEEEKKKKSVEKTISEWAGEAPLKRLEKETDDDEKRSNLKKSIITLHQSQERAKKEKEAVEFLAEDYMETFQDIENHLSIVRKLRFELEALSQEERKLEVLQEVSRIDSLDTLKGIIFRLVEDNPNLLSQVEIQVQNIDEISHGKGKKKDKSSKKSGRRMKSGKKSGKKEKNEEEMSEKSEKDEKSEKSENQNQV